MSLEKSSDFKMEISVQKGMETIDTIKIIEEKDDRHSEECDYRVVMIE